MGNDEKRRDYDIAELSGLDDRRLKIINKEAGFAWSFVLIYTTVCYLAYFFLPPATAEECAYLFGFPVWFILCSAISAIAIAVMIVYTLKLNKDFSLAARESEKEELS